MKISTKGRYGLRVMTDIAVNTAKGGLVSLKDIAEREGRNPQTNETITIAAYKKPAFSAAKALKEAINE